jgi:acetyl esterase/lipase
MNALKLSGLSLLLVSTPSLSDAAQNEPLSSGRVAGKVIAHHASGPQSGPLSTASSLSDLLNHPAFTGFSRLLLPWDDRSYDGEMRLNNISSLLPYHSHVTPDVVVEALNRMIDDANNGKSIFVDFYTEAQKRADPSKQHAGLFFFRGKPGAPFAIIAPGGGFSYVGSVHEGFSYAVEINQQGYNVFVLKYRAGFGGGVATQDLSAAISYIFDHAETLGVGTQDYSVWGSSAGARMAASIGSHGVAAFGGKKLPKPATVVMAYTGHADYSTDEPPTFVVVGDRDGIAPPAIMERRVVALTRAGTPVEYHRYPNIGHGFGSGTGTRAEGWVTDATRFWERFIAKD